MSALLAVAQTRSWDDIKPLEEKRSATSAVDYAPLEARLKEMAQPVRKVGETLLTGERLIFDYAGRSIRMEQHVLVTDDRGVLQAEVLTGRFSESNRVERVLAEGDVRIQSGGRQATAERAAYAFESGVVELDGKAQIEDLQTGNRLSGEQITFWTKGTRKAICHPNAQLVLESLEGLREDGTMPQLEGSTEIRADRMVYDEEKLLVELAGSVWVKNAQATLDAGRALIYLRSTNEVDYVEAQDGIMIRSEGRSARADQALYRYASGEVTLKGRATLSSGGNQLSGEWIQFWVAEGQRRMVCEPNATLVIADVGEVAVAGVPAANAGGTEIRSDRLVVDEQARLAEFDGNVRVRDARAGMDCEKVRIYLKESNEIDWIEALNEVIIQSGGRKALAERAEYHVDKGKFVLEGSPKLKDGRNILTGDRIVFWRETGKMVCEPNVRVLLYPDENIRQRFLKDIEE